VCCAGSGGGGVRRKELKRKGRERINKYIDNNLENSKSLEIKP
jgi:hypothetical protein